MFVIVPKNKEQCCVVFHTCSYLTQKFTREWNSLIQNTLVGYGLETLEYDALNNTICLSYLDGQIVEADIQLIMPEPQRPYCPHVRSSTHVQEKMPWYSLEKRNAADFSGFSEHFYIKAPYLGAAISAFSPEYRPIHWNHAVNIYSHCVSNDALISGHFLWNDLPTEARAALTEDPQYRPMGIVEDLPFPNCVGLLGDLL